MHELDFSLSIEYDTGQGDNGWTRTFVSMSCKWKTNGLSKIVHYLYLLNVDVKSISYENCFRAGFKKSPWIQCRFHLQKVCL